MQTPILFFVALALFWVGFAMFISVPPQGDPPEFPAITERCAGLRWYRSGNPSS